MRRTLSRMPQRLCVALFALSLLAACAAPPAREGTRTATSSGPPIAALTPEPARDFTLETLEGGTITLSDLQGQWVLLNFWATWCGPCVREMAYLGALAEERDLAVLGVNFNEERADVAKFVEEHAIGFPILLDPDDITLLVYQVRALPRTYIVDPHGRVAAQVLGEINSAELDSWLDAHGVESRVQ